MVQAPVKPVPAPSRAPTLNAHLAEAPPIALRLPPQWELTDERVIELGESNELLIFERTAEGVLQITLPAGFGTGRNEASVGAQIVVWRFERDLGEATGATSGYSLPDGALLVPDAAWISDERLAGLAGIEIEDTKPLPAVPDFVLEVRSLSQNIRDQQEKMERWMANGVRLGWLIDPYEALVWIYREGRDEPELLKRPDTLSGEDVMVGLVVDLTRLWRANEGRGD